MNVALSLQSCDGSWRCPLSTTFAIEYMLIEELHPDPANPRSIAEPQRNALEHSIMKFGVVQPILARREDRTVIGGHQRLMAARRLGYRTVPVILLDVDQAQGRLLSLALNRISGEWDDILLAQLLSGLELRGDVDLTLSGFDPGEITELLRSLDVAERRHREETFDVYAAIADLRAPAVTQPGDLITLGDHLLLCADSTQPASFARLLGSAHTAMAFVDAPYNARYEGGPGQQRRAIANDALPPDEWAAFVGGWAPLLVEWVDGAIYLCMSSQEMPMVSLAMAAAGAHWSDTIIWSKDHFTLGRADYQRQYEPIFYGWREGAKHQWHGERAQGDVWTIPRPVASPLHSTMKPLALVERALENSSSSGDLVLDCFLGSGSTLIACERTGRRCRGIELDAHYCDIIVARWESLTGRIAIREGA